MISFFGQNNHNKKKLQLGKKRNKKKNPEGWMWKCNLQSFVLSCCLTASEGQRWLWFQTLGGIFHVHSNSSVIMNCCISVPLPLETGFPLNMQGPRYCAASGRAVLAFALYVWRICWKHRRPSMFKCSRAAAPTSVLGGAVLLWTRWT